MAVAVIAIYVVGIRRSTPSPEAKRRGNTPVPGKSPLNANARTDPLAESGSANGSNTAEPGGQSSRGADGIRERPVSGRSIAKLPSASATHVATTTGAETAASGQVADSAPTDGLGRAWPPTIEQVSRELASFFDLKSINA